MTEKANPSINRPIDAFQTAGAIALAGGEDGWISPSSAPSELSVQDGDITESNLNAFTETSDGTSLDVTIDGGEAFIYGSWLAIDTSTTVTLASSTTGQTVYVGWNKDGTDDVIIGPDSAFATASGDTDEKIPLYDFDTDGSGVTSVYDRREIGQTTERLTSSTGLTSYLIDGGTFTVNYTTPEVDVTTGTAIINNDVTDRAFLANWRAQTVSLTDSSVNHIYVDYDTTNSTTTIVANTTGTSPDDDSLKIGEIDTTNDTKSEQWYLITDSGQLSFPDESAAIAAEPNLREGTQLYERLDNTYYKVT